MIHSYERYKKANIKLCNLTIVFAGSEYLHNPSMDLDQTLDYSLYFKISTPAKFILFTFYHCS